MSTAPTLHPLVTRLRERAEAAHLTQREIAEQLGVSERAISYWFTSDMIPQKRYRKVIEQWLEVADEAA